MNKVAQIRIGIINCETKKVIKEKTVDLEVALEEAEKISRWFDKQDTFFPGKPIWKCWERLGMLAKFEKLVEGISFSDVAVGSTVVFKGTEHRVEEHEFYMQKA